MVSAECSMGHEQDCKTMLDLQNRVSGSYAMQCNASRLGFLRAEQSRRSKLAAGRSRQAKDVTTELALPCTCAACVASLEATRSIKPGTGMQVNYMAVASICLLDAWTRTVVRDLLISVHADASTT
jgi:hypothetical protein